MLIKDSRGKIKVGDKVHAVDVFDDYQGIITKINETGDFTVKVGRELRYFYISIEGTVKIIKSNNGKAVSIMNDLIQKFTLMFKGEPAQAFQKAGITENNDILTDDGAKIFLSWLLKREGKTFKEEVVDGLLKEDK